MPSGGSHAFETFAPQAPSGSQSKKKIKEKIPLSDKSIHSEISHRDVFPP